MIDARIPLFLSLRDIGHHDPGPSSSRALLLDPILVDARVMEPSWIVLGGGNRSSKLKLAPAALSTLPSVRVVESLAVPR